MRPEPEIIYEIPDTARIVIDRAWRKLKAKLSALAAEFASGLRTALDKAREDIDALRVALRKPQPDPVLAVVFARAAYDAATGGKTVEQEQFVWKARTKAYGVKRARRVERNGTAYVQRRGPLFHNTKQA